MVRFVSEQIYPGTVIDVFISHSSLDADLAAKVVDLLRSALSLRPDLIRCSSVSGYRLPIGADSDEQLRNEVFAAKCFVGILSPASLQSTYVLFELGARWGAGKHLAPLLAGGMHARALKAPLAGLSALACADPAQVHQFVSDIGQLLGLRPEAPHIYQGQLEAVIRICGQSSRPGSDEPRTNTQGRSDNTRDPVKATLSAGDDEYANAEEVIKKHCEKEWQTDFSTRAYCIQQQREAVVKLRAGRPEDIPEDVFLEIRLKCAADWPDDYSTRFYAEQQQFTGYRSVNAD